MSVLLLHEYIERISRLLHSESRRVGSEYNLQPIQLHALHYLKRSNRYSNTPQGVTDYFGLTKGTVSQTLMALESKGFIRKKQDKKDGRVVHLNVTRGGKKLLEKTMPSPTMENAWRDLEYGDQKQLLEDLKRLLISMQKTNGMRAFGICSTCKYNKKSRDNEFFCQLTQEKLTPKETELLCREHQPVE